MSGSAKIKDALAALGISASELRVRGLWPHPEATSLEVAEVGRDGREHRLVPAAAAAWRALKAAAESDGQSIFIVSAYRGMDRQAEIIRNKLASGQSIDEILRVCAAPGYSEHHTGCAVDVGTEGVPVLEEAFEHSSAFEWLRSEASRYGFKLSYPRGNPYGYQYEPWHWCHRAAP